MVDAAQAVAARMFTTRRAYHRWDPDAAAEVLARIEDGKGLREVCAERDMPVHATVLRWIKERPEFERDYRRAREAQADRLFDVAWRIACEAGPGELAAARLKIQTLKWRVGKRAPRVYGPIKAQEPSGDRGGGEPAAPARVSFVLRRWAQDPQGRMVECTWAAQRMSEAEVRAMREAIASGAMDADEVARLNDEAVAASEAEGWRVRRQGRA